MQFIRVNSAAPSAPFITAQGPLASSPPRPRSIVDRLLIGMVGTGLGLEALSAYLGLARPEIEVRLAELDLPRPHDRPLRRVSGKNPWTIKDLRRLMALWFENVGVSSIAEALGRSRASIHAKRRRLGLELRERTLIRERSTQDCPAVILPWRPHDEGQTEISVDVDRPRAVASLFPTKAGVQIAVEKAVAVVASKAAPTWRLGRDGEKDMRFSILGFAGLKAPAVAARMDIEFGLTLTVSAVNNRLSRLQIVRERGELIAVYDAAIVERRAKENMDRLGASLRECAELHRSFWYCRTLGGNRTTCRELYTKKFAQKQAERSCGDVLALAA